MPRVDTIASAHDIRILVTPLCPVTDSLVPPPTFGVVPVHMAQTKIMADLVSGDDLPRQLGQVVAVVEEAMISPPVWLHA